MGVIVDVVEPIAEKGTVVTTASVVEIIVEDKTLLETSVANTATVEIVESGGYLANVGWGYDFPENPREGQLFIKLEQ